MQIQIQCGNQPPTSSSRALKHAYKVTNTYTNIDKRTHITTHTYIYKQTLKDTDSHAHMFLSDVKLIFMLFTKQT